MVAGLEAVTLESHDDNREGGDAHPEAGRRGAGFTGDADAVAGQAIASTEGFTLVLAGLKALLEHDVRLNLVADRFPKGLEDKG